MPTKKELNDEANDFHRLWGDEQIRRRKAETALAHLIAAADKADEKGNNLIPEPDEHGYDVYPVPDVDKIFDELHTEVEAARKVLG